MRMRSAVSVCALTTVGAVAAVLFLFRPATTQTAAYRAARSPYGDGSPNLNGIWQAANTANWNLEGHSAEASPVVAMGTWGAVPAGQSVVEGGEIPYRPEVLAKRKEHLAKRMSLDPEVRCYLPGVPRVMYQPFPFQIVQTPTHILMAFEFASASRTVHMKSLPPAPVDSWMGQSEGRWEGDTLVITSTSFNDLTWFDRAGNFHSDGLRVVERLTPTSPDALHYEATIEDSKVFTRPWKISMPLYRRLEKNVQLLEFKCVPFVEELMYGHLLTKTTN